VVVLKRHCRGAQFRVRDAAALDRVLPAIALADAGFGADAAVPAPAWQLSPRESEVAALSCRGMHNAEIALLLGTSRNTVKKQLARVFEKVGVSNRTELATAMADPA
jgi:DNA-binding CsgD family transcriptional regulator